MKRQRFLGTWAAILVLGGLGAYIYFVENKRDPATLDDGKKKEKVFTFDKTKVKGLAVATAGEPEVRLVREKEAWRIIAPMAVPADATEANAMVTSLETLESDEVVAESAADLAEYGLATPRATITLEVDGQPQPLILALGEKTPDGGALYARRPSASRVFTIPAYVEASLLKKPFDLRDRDVLHVKRDDVRALEVTGPQGAYALAKGDKGAWAFTAPLTTAAGRWSIDALLGTLENLRMESVAAEEAADPAPFGLAPPQRTVTLSLIDGNRRTLEIGGSPGPGKHHVRVLGSSLVALIPGALVEDLAKGMGELRAKRVLEVSSYEIEGFDTETGGVKRVYARSTAADKDGGDTHTWKRVTPDGKDVALSAVQDTLFAVGGLEVQEFVDAPAGLEAYGLAPAALRVNLRATGGKPPSWFEIGEKDGAAYARRNDDAAVLKLDPTKARELIESFKKL